MIRILTDLPDSDIPVLPGLTIETIENPSMTNKVIVISCKDEREVLIEAFKLIRLQQMVIENRMAPVIYLNDGPTKNVA